MTNSNLNIDPLTPGKRLTSHSTEVAQSFLLYLTTQIDHSSHRVLRDYSPCNTLQLIHLGMYFVSGRMKEVEPYFLVRDFDIDLSMEMILIGHAAVTSNMKSPMILVEEHLGKHAVTRQSIESHFIHHQIWG
jgi:hypothetical protein